MLRKHPTQADHIGWRDGRKETMRDRWMEDASRCLREDGKPSTRLSRLCGRSRHHAMHYPGDRRGLAHAVRLLLPCRLRRGHNFSLNSPSSPAAASRQLVEARFDVDVASGKVQVTPVQDSRAAKQSGRAIFNAAAISFTSSDLITTAGDSGQRVLTLTATNNTNQTLPPTLRVVVGNLTNTAAGSNAAGAAVVSTLAGNGTTSIVDGDGTAASFASP